MATARLFRLFFVATILSSSAILLADEYAPAPEKNTDAMHAIVTMTIRDGRVLQGPIDDKTNDEVVWIRVNRGAMVLSTGFTWDLVQEIQIGDQRLSAAEFRPIAKSYATPSPKLSSLERDASRSPTIPPRRDLPTPRVESLQVFAEVSNWDRDAESDGIALRVLPLGHDGQVLEVDGVLTVELIGRHFVTDRKDQGFPTLCAWSQRVRIRDFQSSGGASYQLPATNSLDHDLSLLSIGMVRVQLQVFHQGHFDAVAPIRLKSYNPIRDQLDQHRSRYDAFGRYRARHW